MPPQNWDFGEGRCDVTASTITMGWGEWYWDGTQLHNDLRWILLPAKWQPITILPPQHQVSGTKMAPSLCPPFPILLFPDSASPSQPMTSGYFHQPMASGCCGAHKKVPEFLLALQVHASLLLLEHLLWLVPAAIQRWLPAAAWPSKDWVIK